MPVSTTTKLSLLLRLRDSSDNEAWATFVRVYGPLVYRFAIREGFQDADAADLVQDVLREVANSIGRFDYDPEVGRFRSWLLTVARYSMNRVYRSRHRHATGTGDTQMAKLLQNHPADGEGNDAVDEFWEREYQQRLFEWAAEQVRAEVNEITWDAFWLVAVEDHAPADVARRLSIKVGSVYVAKNRVLARLRKRIREIDPE